MGASFVDYLYLGVNGFGWARWGSGTRGDTKTRQAETKIVDQGMFSPPMVGKISPNIMFL